MNAWCSGFASLRYAICAGTLVFSVLTSTLHGQTYGCLSGSGTINQYGVHGTQNVAAPTNVPGGRLNSATWTDGAGDVWLFGGSGYGTTGSVGFLNDLWKYDAITCQWSWLKGSTATAQYGTYGAQVFPPQQIRRGDVRTLRSGATARVTSGCRADSATPGRPWVNSATCGSMILPLGTGLG